MSLLDLRATPITVDHADINEMVVASIASMAPMLSSAAVVVESRVVEDVCVFVLAEIL